jgi:hypothetical protein
MQRIILRAQWELDMTQRKQIRQLAYAIWEKEGCPQGRADAHWRMAEKFLEEQEVEEVAGVPSHASLSNQLLTIRKATQKASRTADYYFRFSLAVAMMAIGITLAFLAPPVAIVSGLDSRIVGGIIGLLGWVLIVASGIVREPGRYRRRTIRASLGLMVVGILSILIGAILKYHAASNFSYLVQLLGLGAFALGVLIANFSLRRQAQGESDLAE